MPAENLLLIADSDKDADMLYAVGMFVPDPFIYLRLRGRHYVVMNDLEIDRAKKEAAHCRVMSLSKIAEKLKGTGVKRAPLPEIAREVLREKNIRAVTVPATFPHGMACALEATGVRVKPNKGNLFPRRELKSHDEIRKIKAAVAMAEVGMAEAIQAIRRSRVAKGGQLIYRNAPLTSERMHALIGAAVFQAGGIAAHTIVAGGDQAVDPHERGHGPLKSDTPIIIDIFPRAEKTGYYGDITRTVVKGRASEGVRALYATVLKAQQIGIARLRAGQPIAHAHRAVAEHFENAGYATGRSNGRMEGFYHSTGHGIGLEVHEAPGIGHGTKGKFRAGHVVTVEPGLYYPKLGGVRLEDDLVVTQGRPRNLTRCEKVLEV